MTAETKRAIIPTIREEIKASKERLTQKIDDTQEDTIDALSELIHTGYNMHAERIEKIERYLGFPPPRQE